MIIDQLETAETNQLESEIKEQFEPVATDQPESDVATDQPESDVTPRLRDDTIYQPASEIIDCCRANRY